MNGKATLEFPINPRIIGRLAKFHPFDAHFSDELFEPDRDLPRKKRTPHEWNGGRAKQVNYGLDPHLEDQDD